MKTITQLKAEIKELKLDYEIAQGRYHAATRELMVREATARLEKQAKCKHTFRVQGERQFEGAGFIDIEYDVCTKCKHTANVRTVNTVLKSEK